MAPGRMARRPGETWDPKFPDYATDPSWTRKVGTITPPEIWKPKFDRHRLMWIPAPPPSHLLSFAFDDSRTLLAKKTPEGGYYVDSPRDLPDSAIYVKFKGKNNRPVVSYGYFSKNHALLDYIFKEMVERNGRPAGDGPGVILHALLEKNPEIEYRQMV